MSDPGLVENIPFLSVSNMRASLDFYTGVLGFTVELDWRPNGEIVWCTIRRGPVALMLQAFTDEQGNPKIPAEPGAGITLVIMCRDALAMYRQAREAGADPERPVVGNGLWVASFRDPDGYRIDFESPTSEPEESIYQG